MNTVGQMMALRAKPNRHLLALRDEPDYSNDREEKIETIFRPLPIDKELDQLKAEVRFLRNKLTEMQAYKQKENTPF